MYNDLSVTELLCNYRNGDNEVLPDLLNQVYGELRKIAAREKKRVFNADTINTSALVNEAYLKLFSKEKLDVENRAHFFAVSSMAMRQILINYVEQKTARKRGGDQLRVTLATMADTKDMEIVTLLSINNALGKLRELDESLVSLVEMRFFAGMRETDIAQVLNTSERTVRRNWSKAKALLQQILDDNNS